MSALQVTHSALLRAAPALRNRGGSFIVFQGACINCGSDVEANGRSDQSHCEPCFLDVNSDIAKKIALDYAQTNAAAVYGHASIPQQMDPPSLITGYGMAGHGAYPPPAYGQTSTILFPPFTSQLNTAGQGGPHLQSNTPAADPPLTLKITNVAAAQRLELHPPPKNCIKVAVPVDGLGDADDDFQTVQSSYKALVKDFYVALTADGTPTSDPAQERVTHFTKQQNTALEYIKAKLSTPFLRRTAKAWIGVVIGKIVSIHKNGILPHIHEVAETKGQIDSGIKCSRRTELLIQLVRDDKSVARNLIEGDNIDQMAFGPMAFRKSKKTNTINAADRKQEKVGGDEGDGVNGPKPKKKAKKAASKAAGGKRKKPEVEEGGEDASHPSKKMRSGEATTAEFPGMLAPWNSLSTTTAPTPFTNNAMGYGFQSFPDNNFQAPVAPMQAPPMNGPSNSEGQATPIMMNHPELSFPSDGGKPPFDFGSSPADLEQAGGISGGEYPNDLPETLPPGFGAYGPSSFKLGAPYDPPSTTPGLTSASRTPQDSSVTPQGASPYGGEATGFCGQSTYGFGVAGFGNIGTLPTMGAMQDMDYEEFSNQANGVSHAKDTQPQEKESGHEQTQEPEDLIYGLQDPTIDDWLREMGETFGNGESSFDA